MTYQLPAYLEEQGRLHKLELARRKQKPDISFTDFKHRFWRGYVHNTYHELIGDYLRQVADYVLSEGQRGVDRLMINIPPRHGKSAEAQRFQAWLLGMNPDIPIISCAYNASLATRNSREVRKIIKDDKYQQLFPTVRLASDSAAVNRWHLEGREGGMIAVGVGGGVTGWGGKLIFVDDTVKSRAEAESPTYRQRAIDWWTNDIMTRLEQPGGAVVFTNTRWQLNDLAGWVLENEPDRWTIINLPALALDNDPLGREPGEALWPERYNEEWLNKQRELMGEYAFSALYQQQPLPPGGALFDTSKIEIIDYVPECKKVVRFYDLAVTAKKHSDYTVGLKLGITNDERFVILHVYRVQKTTPEIQEAIVQNAAIDGRSVAIRLEAEKAGIIQLDYLLRDPRMNPYVIDKKAPEGDKYTRATPVAARVNAGRVMMVKGQWNRAFLDELSVFPQADNDDQVDGLSGAYDMLNSQTAITSDTMRPELADLWTRR